jgi:hypothetical protein
VSQTSRDIVCKNCVSFVKRDHAGDTVINVQVFTLLQLDLFTRLPFLRFSHQWRGHTWKFHTHKTARNISSGSDDSSEGHSCPTDISGGELLCNI